MINGRFFGLVMMFSLLLLFLLAGRFSLRWEDHGRGGSELAVSVALRFPSPVVVADGGALIVEAWPVAFSQALHAAFVRNYAASPIENEVTWESFMGRLASLVRIEAENTKKRPQNSTGSDKR